VSQTILIELFRGFHQEFRETTIIMPQIKSRPLPSTSFAINYPLTIITFDTILSELPKGCYSLSLVHLTMEVKVGKFVPVLN
jgi:hypothetical protein